MNNLRLLAGMLCASLWGGGAETHAQSPITLEDIFQSVEERSLQLRPLLTAETEACEDARIARIARLPEIDASLNVSYIGDGFTTARNLSDYHKASIPHFGAGLGVTVTQPIYAGGAITASIELSDLKSTAARYATDLSRNNLRFQLTGYYLDIYKYINLKDVVESNIISARKVLGDMQARYEQGTVLQNEITRYELLLSGLELKLVQIENMLEILNTDLVTISGLPAGTKIVPDTTMLRRALPKADCDSWIREAETSSPTIQLGKTGVEISRRSETLTRAERMPKVGLRAGWTIDGPILVEVPPINRNLSYWYVGVGVSYNLSSLYKTDKTLARSKAATRRAAEELDATRESVRLAVRTDYVKYLEAYETLYTHTKSLELAERNYATTSIRYSEGMALITDMLDAADARLNAAQQLVNARIDILYYYYKLLFVTGKI